MLLYGNIEATDFRVLQDCRLTIGNLTLIFFPQLFFKDCNLLALNL